MEKHEPEYAKLFQDHKIEIVHFLSPQSHQDCPTTKYNMDKISVKIRENKFEPLEHEKA
jgi:hypothetical protein